MVVEAGSKIIFNMKDVLAVEGEESNREGAWLGKFPGLVRPQYFLWKRTKNERV
jgi:hypothetical protein